MKFLLLISCWLTITCSAFAQAPAIEGDVMLCPYTNGTATITTNQTYDTYQWYYKYWFLNDAYAAIDGATAASFTYDWYTYDQALLKVVVTSGGQTYESNAIQIDSYAWVGLDVMSEFNDAVTINQNDGSFLLCDGGAITNSIGSPYTIIQWYKNDVAVEGATGSTFVITEPGTYYATAAPGFCPNSVSNTLPLVVTVNPDCSTPEVTAPVIAGENVMMCPWTTSTASVTNNQTYDTYQWYYKYWFTDDEFEAIDGATSATFDYDWYTYDQAIFKLVVTSGGQTFESNTIQIDSYNWVSLDFTLDFSEGVVPDDATFSYLICEGDTITNTLPDLYSANIQWYRNDEPIEGANSQVYVITEPGTYYVSAGPGICPDPVNNSNTMANPVVVSWNPECTAGVHTPDTNAFILYPNPANTVLNISLPDGKTAENYIIYDVTGKTLMQGALGDTTSAINIERLSAGNYFIKVSGQSLESTKLFIKQ